MSRKVAQVSVTVVFVDEFNALSQEGPIPFSGDVGSTAIAKVKDALDKFESAANSSGDGTLPDAV